MVCFEYFNLLIVLLFLINFLFYEGKGNHTFLGQVNSSSLVVGNIQDPYEGLPHGYFPIVKVHVDHYPIHGPVRLPFKWKENMKKNEKKMWVDFQVLENPSSRGNSFCFGVATYFYFYF